MLQRERADRPAANQRYRTGIEAIGRGMGVPTSDLSRPAKQLIEAKTIKTTGEKRATKYFPRG